MSSGAPSYGHGNDPVEAGRRRVSRTPPAREQVSSWRVSASAPMKPELPDSPSGQSSVGRERLAGVVVALLATVGTVVGLWAALDPRGFYRDFPGGGRTWVAVDGPYNEHLVRDFGALNLALAAVAIVALWRPVRELRLAVAVGNLAYGVPHLVYHLRHLEVYDTADQVANVGSLASAVVLALVLLALTVVDARRERGQPPRRSTGMV